jgi:zinc/manganese transport system permease protein
MNWELLDLSILWPAFVAGLIVLSTHVPLGQRVLARGIIFIDLAIAQIAALGVIAAQFAGLEEHGLAVQAAAAVAALLGAALLSWTDSRWPHKQEALIGTLFVLAATAAILLLASHPHGGEHLKELLVGQILWVSPSQLVPAAIVSALLLLAIALRSQDSKGFAFYAIFALAITQSVQLVGVYLVFASLIIPALATDHLRAKRRLLIAMLIGVVGYGLGLAASALSDLPSGAMIVWALAVTGLVGRLLSKAR